MTGKLKAHLIGRSLMGYGGLAGLPPDQIVSKQQSPQLLIE